MAEQTPLTVSQAVNVAKGAVTSIPTMVVLGEVTGFRGPNARSGHCYFQVKDDSFAMDAIVWRNTYARSGIRLRDGMQVLLTGKFDVYAATGRLSFIAKSITASGEGLLRQQVAQLARKLEREGLMDPARKRPVPRFCMRVCVVTSLSGSVIDDVKRTLRRRNPLVQLDCVGAQVQGPGAPQTIIRALRVAAASQPEAILLVRGGGSFEDLMTFNDEGLARAVAACPVPVVTGIGHEPDTSICDMVADKRCSTPTAAAESVAPALDEVYETILRRRERLGAAMSAIVERDQQQVQLLGNAAGRSMGARLSRERVSVEALARRTPQPWWRTAPTSCSKASSACMTQCREASHAGRRNWTERRAGWKGWGSGCCGRTRPHSQGPRPRLTHCRPCGCLPAAMRLPATRTGRS